MTDEQRLLFIRGRLLEAEIRMNGMIADNKICEARGETPRYEFEHFEKLINDNNLSHNELLTSIRGDL